MITRAAVVRVVAAQFVFAIAIGVKEGQTEVRRGARIVLLGVKVKCEPVLRCLRPIARP